MSLIFLPPELARNVYIYPYVSIYLYIYIYIPIYRREGGMEGMRRRRDGGRGKGSRLHSNELDVALAVGKWW
jgi:hypothetical protein